MRAPRSPAARAIDRAIVFYQRATVHRLPRCRYYPTCSQYAREALADHGAVSGSWLALRRLGRCQPFGGHGFDPVPDAPLARRDRTHRAHRLGRADQC